MPRTKPPEDRRTRTIQIRVNDEEFELLQQEADASHLELSTFLRQLGLFTAKKRAEKRAR